jgi:hypothetical protein
MSVFNNGNDSPLNAKQLSDLTTEEKNDSDFDLGNAVNYYIGSGVDASGVSKYNYNFYTQNTLTAGNIAADNLFNILVRDRIPQTPLDGGTFDYSSYWFILWNSILGEIGANQPIQNFTIADLQAVNSNLAVRVHLFETDLIADTRGVVSIVDVTTGIERFRVNTQEVGPVLLRHVKRVTNGIPDPNLESDLSFGEMLEIGTCIQYAFEGIVSTTEPPLDGWNGDIVLNLYNKIAVTKQDNAPSSNLLGIPFLPWNKTVYNMYDMIQNKYLQPNAFTSQNFFTILKLIGIGLIVADLVYWARYGKLILPHLKSNQ